MNADIVIIGAGIAGLRCGITLLRKRPSRKIVILEKYNYVGGRVVTYHKKIEDMKGHCSSVQWEIGAGRIHKSHTKVMALLHKYKLHTIPLDDKMLYEEDGILTQNIFTETMGLLQEELTKLPKHYLATHTVREAVTDILGEEKANALLIQFPYRAEVDSIRADMGLESFQDEMGTYKGYVVVQEGLSALIKGMRSEFESLGGTIFQGQTVVDIQKQENTLLVKTKTEAGDVLWQAETVICALHRDAFAEIPVFKEWDLLKKVKMAPLVRTYAVFPVEKGKSWFSGLPKVTSAGPIRFFIPMNAACGTVMLSYTDDKDARYIMRRLDKDGEEKTGEYLVEEVRKMFPEKDIPDPLFFKSHPWTSGCTYWLPGSYDPYLETKKAMKPFSDMELYCCGESFSVRQAWIEGALEHTDLMLQTYF
jgi:monoamine oxidase